MPASDIDPRAPSRQAVLDAPDDRPQGLSRPIVRVDSGLISSDVAFAARCLGADLAIAVTRNPTASRACRAIEEGAWFRANDREAAVAFCDYLPQGRPEGTRCVVRRVVTCQAGPLADGGPGPSRPGRRPAGGQP